MRGFFLCGERAGLAGGPCRLDQVKTAVYAWPMFELVKSATFNAWFRNLRVRRAWN